MRFLKKKNKVKITIEFDKQTEEMKIVANPESLRPTEIIQIFMYAINIVNVALQNELQRKKRKKKKKKKLGYIG